MWVIYLKETSAAIKGKYGINIKYFKTEGAAKAGRTRIYKKKILDWGWNPETNERASSLRYPPGSLGIAESNDYHQNIEKMVTQVNMMSGKEYQESINTPSCCSPASETYWSM